MGPAVPEEGHTVGVGDGGRDRTMSMGQGPYRDGQCLLCNQ